MERFRRVATGAFAGTLLLGGCVVGERSAVSGLLVGPVGGPKAGTADKPALQADQPMMVKSDHEIWTWFRRAKANDHMEYDYRVSGIPGPTRSRVVLADAPIPAAAPSTAVVVRPAVVVKPAITVKPAVHRKSEPPIVQLASAEGGASGSAPPKVRVFTPKKPIFVLPAARSLPAAGAAGKAPPRHQQLAAAAPREAALNPELSQLLKTHPKIAVAKERVKAADAGIRESQAPFWPQVKADGEYGHSDIDSPQRRAVEGQKFSGVTNQVGLEVALNVFDGLGKYAKLNRSRLEKVAAELELETERQTLLFQGVSAYLNVLRQIKLLELARINEKTIREQLRLEDERVKRGSGLNVDVLQAKSRLQISKQLRVQIEGDLQTALSRYIQVFGHMPKTKIMTDPKPPLTALPPSLKTALEGAKSLNPKLKKAMREIEIAEQRRKAAEAQYYPRIDLVFEARRRDNTDGIVGLRRDVAFKVRMTWELFNGFATQSRVIKAARLRAAAQNNHRYVHRQVEDEARIAWFKLKTQRKRELLLSNAINIASEVFRARRELRAAGKETVINVLDAEREVNRARIQHTAARYDALLGVYRVHFTLGQLTPTTLGLPGS